MVAILKCYGDDTGVEGKFNVTLCQTATFDIPLGLDQAEQY